MNRRDFVKCSAIAATGIAAGIPAISFAEENKKYEEYDYATMFKPQSCPYDRIDSFFETIPIKESELPEFPLDLVVNHATINENHSFVYRVANGREYVETRIGGDYLEVNLYDVASSVSWRYGNCLVEDKNEENGIKEISIAEAKYENKKILNPFKILEDGYVRKIIDDQFSVLVSAGFDRNMVVIDSDNNGIKPRINSLMKTVMRRNGGGNSTSVRRGKMTDLLVPEELVRDYQLTDTEEKDETLRRQIYIDSNGYLGRYYGVNIHPRKELNLDGEFAIKYLPFWTNSEWTFPKGKTHLVIGLDLSKNSFVMPVRDYIIEKDNRVETKMRKEIGYIMMAKQGIACLDNKTVLLGMV